jgi:transcriptional regulator with GAF, ATPase, and Fis domain
MLTACLMPLSWTLKQWLTANRGLQLRTSRAHSNAKKIQNIIQHRTGYKIPLTTVHTLLEKQPKTLDSKILQAICDTFQCELNDFCAVSPAPSPPIPQFSPLKVGETLKDRLKAQERWHIVSALKSTNWNKAAAARLLGTTRQSLRERMLALEIFLTKP